jgi:uncharacterized coiled-coil protein SlyX
VDSQFLEFWGNFFLAAAKGQKQMEDLARWMSQGIKTSGFEDLAAMFTRAYGLKEPGPDNASDEGTWEAAARQFNRSFKEYMALMGMVSSEDHRRLQKKYESLEKKCADQEETIAHLRRLIGAGEFGHEEVVKNFQSILQKQSTQFRDLVDSSSRFLKAASAPSKPTKKPR